LDDQFGLFDGFHQRFALKHLRQVLVALQKFGALQPRYRRAHFGIIAAIALFEELGQIFIAQQFLGGNDDLIVLVLFAAPQAFQDSLDFIFSDLGYGAHLKLGFGIVGRIQQDAMGRCQIASGAAGLLQVVFQRSRKIVVQHQPDIAFVDPHAKRIGGANHRNPAIHKFLDDAPFLMGSQAAMESVGRQTFLNQIIANLFGGLSFGRIDDRAGGRVAL